MTIKVGKKILSWKKIIESWKSLKIFPNFPTFYFSNFRIIPKINILFTRKKYSFLYKLKKIYKN